MEKAENSASRKKFFLWGLGIIFSITALRFIFPAKKKKNTIKMLTQDGKLVEIDKDLISGSKRKITDAELKTWIRNKIAQH